MRIVSALIVALSLAVPGMACADTYQLWLEQFDESRGTTICKYRSGMGDYEVAEYSGYHLCPRVACASPAKDNSSKPVSTCPQGEPLPLS